MIARHLKLGLICATSAALSSCVSMPDFGDNPPPPEIAEEIARNKSFPDVRNAPALPRDLKKTVEWEGAVNRLTGQSNVFDIVNANAPIASPSEIMRRISNLKSYVDGHYSDDAAKYKTAK